MRNHHGPKSGIFGPLSFRDDQLQVGSLLDRFGGVTTVDTGSTRNSANIELTELIDRMICDTQRQELVTAMAFFYAAPEFNRRRWHSAQRASSVKPVTPVAIV